MNLPAFCIRRPAFTIVMSLVITMVGLIGFMSLPLRWIPNINPPEVSIMTVYQGANANLVEKDITKVLESSLSGIDGIEMMTSRSRQGMSEIDITFKLGRDMNSAIEDVRANIESVRDALPSEVKSPLVSKADPNNEPIMYISFNNSILNEQQMSDYVYKTIVPLFETTDGVGNVLMFGGRVSAVRIWLDPAKMFGANVTVDEVTRLLQDQNASIPGGQIRGLDRYYSIVTDTSMKTIEQFDNLIIRDNNNQAVRIKDIGETKIDAANADSSFRVDGKSAIALALFAKSNANPLDVEKNAQRVIADLKRTMPAGVSVQVLFNQADYIRDSIRSVYESFFESVLLVWLVVFAFLCSFRATLIPIITIPVCMIGTFAILYACGFSINTITLMAFVLAIGLVVDDAIVMLENVSRHMEKGLSAYTAALIGSREIIFPIIAMTLTLAAVYAPIAFTQGLLGVLFKEFTFTLAGAVIISGFVALTLSPMMCSRLLTSSTDTNRYADWMNAQLSSLQARYQSILHRLLSYRLWVVGGLLLVGLLGYGVYTFLPSELAPGEDRDQLYVVLKAPRNASFQYTYASMKQMEANYQTNPDITSYLTEIGIFSGSPSRSFNLLRLKPAGERKQSADAIAADLTAKLNDLVGVTGVVFAPPPPLAQFAGSAMGDNIGMVVMTNNDYRHLQQVTQKIVDTLKLDPSFVHVSNSLKWDGEEFQVNIDRERAADLKVPIQNIASTISTLIGGRTIGKTDDYDIMVQLKPSALSNPNILQELYTRNTSGALVSLSQVLTMQATTAPESYTRYERLRADTIHVNLAPNVTVAAAIKKMQAAAKALLPADMQYTFTGEAKSFMDSSGKTFFTFMLAIIFIYLVLVAQFESFIDPFIILLSVPFAMVGAMISLKLFGGSLNIYSNIGLITLVGLIAKHGILITDFANRLRATGVAIQEAVMQAASLRLRPILMTTAAMVLGAMPLAFATGPGSESRQQIGLVVVGGLLFGTLFSLVVVPIMYTYLAPFRKIKLITTDQE